MNKYLIKGNLLLLFVVLVSCRPQNSVTDSHKPCYSGIYPHLAYYNNEGECGTGAIVPWQNRLWVVTYGLIYHGGPVTNFMKSQTHLEFAHVQKVWEGPLPTD